MNTNDPDLAKAADDFRKGGWIVAILSALGVYAKLLFSTKSYPWLIWVKHGIAGSIVGVIMYFALHGANIDEMYKSIIYCCSGAFAPDLYDSVVEKIKSYLK